MKPVEIVVIVDKSGSMQNLRADVVGGFNTFVEEQKKLPGEAVLTLVQFDTAYAVPIDRQPVKAIGPLTLENYLPGGSTALLDAVGKAVTALRDRTTKDDKAIVCIMTDGEENASTEFKKADIKSLIDSMTKERGWQFVFVGANQDSFHEAGQLGISAQATSNFAPTAAGTRAAYSLMTESATSYRADPNKPVKLVTP